MRDRIVINSKVRPRGTGWCIPITTPEKKLLGIGPDDDLEVVIQVMERKTPKDSE